MATIWLSMPMATAMNRTPVGAVATEGIRASGAQPCDRQFRILPPDDRGPLAGRRRWGGGADRGAVFGEHIERSRPGMTDPIKRLPDMDEEGSMSRSSSAPPSRSWSTAWPTSRWRRPFATR